MKRIIRVVAVLVLALDFVSAGAIETKAADVPTIWSFLGIPQGMHKIHDTLTNRKGKHPGLERKDPLKRIADPANLESEVPAIKAAAEVKADADLAPQKIKAIKYLAEVGCACSSQKVDIQEALLAALDDCTEEVRYEAAVAFCKAAGNPCRHCGSSCCGPDIVKKLEDMAMGQDDNGCWKEQSARVRGAAQRALNACGRLQSEPTPAPETREQRAGVVGPQPAPGQTTGMTWMPKEMPTYTDRSDRLEMPTPGSTPGSQVIPVPVPTVPPAKLTPSAQPATSGDPSITAAPTAVRPAAFTWATTAAERASRGGLHWPKQDPPANSDRRFRGAVVSPLR